MPVVAYTRVFHSAKAVLSNSADAPAGADENLAGQDRVRSRHTDLRRASFLCHMYLRSILLAAALAGSTAQARQVVHVVVALCDNVNQGIVPVPPALGNGQDADRNLYWGAGFGVRTWFERKSGHWTRLGRSLRPSPHIVERIVWKHLTEDVFLVADAYDGAFIEEAINTALTYSAGHQAGEITVNDIRLPIGGNADLIAYCGHDGLMEFAPAPIKAPVSTGKPLIVLACISKRCRSRNSAWR